MNRDRTYLTPQLVLAVFGMFMLGVSSIGFLAEEPTNSSAPSNANPSSQLEVKPSGSTPHSVIDQLQGARGLQGQDSQELQTPIGEQLQPNAKTDDLNSTKPVQ